MTRLGRRVLVGEGLELGTYCGSYVGSSGGVSANFPIPSYQQGISMTANKGSTTMRNVPDVALTADNVYNVSDNGSTGSVVAPVAPRPCGPASPR